MKDAAQGKLVDMHSDTEAIDYYNRALEIDIKINGHNHISVADTYGNMAVVYDSQGQLDKALELYQKSVDISIAALGSDHPDLDASYMTMALICMEQGQQKSLSIMLTTHGDMHPDVANSTQNTGLLFMATNKKEEAKNLFLEAAAIRRKMLGHAHHLTQESERLAAECEEEVLRDTLLNNMAKLKIQQKKQKYETKNTRRRKAATVGEQRDRNTGESQQHGISFSFSPAQSGGFSFGTDGGSDGSDHPSVVNRKDEMVDAAHQATGSGM